jgi:NAD(P)H-nitrite reductase large subunit
VACVEAIRSKDKRSKVTILSAEDYPVYSRCLLSYFLAGDIEEKKLAYRPEAFYKTNKAEALTGYTCEKIIPEKRVLKIRGSKDIAFDRLLVATGAHPKFPAIKGADKDGVFGLRTIRDAKEILKRLKSVKTAAILGGGLIGLKSAYGLSTHNKDIRVIVKSGQVLSQILDKKAAAMFRDWIEKKGIRVMTGLEAVEISGAKEVASVTLDNNERLDCGLVLVGKGVEPNTGLAADSSLKVSGGIVVDSRMETNVEGIYAAGDVAQTKDLMTGEESINALWPNAVEQGWAAGLNMAGAKAVCEGTMAMNSVEFFGLPVITMGITRPREGFEELVYENAGKRVYKKIVLKGGLIAGMIFLGDIRNAGVVGNLIKNRIDVSSIKNNILDENFDFAKTAHLIKANKEKFRQEEFEDIILTY